MFSYGFKHMFDYKDHASAIARLLVPPRRGTVSIIMVREPLQWLISMHRTPYHLSDQAENMTLETFVRARFICHGVAFSNLIELRKMKLKTLQSVELASQNDSTLAAVMHLRYEDLARDQISAVCGVSAGLHLCARSAKVRVQPCTLLGGFATAADGSYPVEKCRPSTREFASLSTELLHFDQAAASVFGPATSTWIIGELDWHVEAFFGYGVPG